MCNTEFDYLYCKYNFYTFYKNHFISYDQLEKVLALPVFESRKDYLVKVCGSMWDSKLDGRNRNYSNKWRKYITKILKHNIGKNYNNTLKYLYKKVPHSLHNKIKSEVNRTYKIYECSPPSIILKKGWFEDENGDLQKGYERIKYKKLKKPIKIRKEEIDKKRKKERLEKQRKRNEDFGFLISQRI